MKEQIKECEAEIDVCNNDLRESDCHRTRMLGRDRFHNRYWWYERNAMPYGGLPDSSTADANYANGRVWVQGPDDTERVGFIELPDHEQAAYSAHFGVTVPERKVKEEGESRLSSARDWGYYDDTVTLDRLIGWLDTKGIREVKLRKELLAQREVIGMGMTKRKAYLDTANKDRSESVESVPRISTRTKTYIKPTGHRFMTWRNTVVVREEGHLHSEAPRSNKKGVARVVSRTKEPTVEEETRKTRGSSKKEIQLESRGGRPIGRQGTRYDF